MRDRRSNDFTNRLPLDVPLIKTLLYYLLSNISYEIFYAKVISINYTIHNYVLYNIYFVYFN